MNDIEARLIAFDRHKDDLLCHLKVCEQQSDEAWRHIRLFARRCLLEEADAETRNGTPDQVKQLRRLENILGKARAALDEIRGPVFVKWCEARGNPDFLCPSMAAYENKFDELTAGIADLETAASRAAEDARRKPGKPRGTGVLNSDFIVSLEHAYRSITGKPGTASRGQFAQFIVKFMGALGRKIEIEAVVQAIRTAKAGERWGRSALA
jgi:hypothetical protein